MGTATIYCGNCDKTFKKEIEFMSDIFDEGMNCVMCSSDNTWLRDADFPEVDDKPLEMGRGGCGRVG